MYRRKPLGRPLAQTRRRGKCRNYLSLDEGKVSPTTLWRFMLDGCITTSSEPLIVEASLLTRPNPAYGTAHGLSILSLSFCLVNRLFMYETLYPRRIVPTRWVFAGRVERQRRMGRVFIRLPPTLDSVAMRSHLTTCRAPRTFPEESRSSAGGLIKDGVYPTKSICTVPPMLMMQSFRHDSLSTFLTAQYDENKAFHNASRASTHNAGTHTQKWAV